MGQKRVDQDHMADKEVVTPSLIQSASSLTRRVQDNSNSKGEIHSLSLSLSLSSLSAHNLRSNKQMDTAHSLDSSPKHQKHFLGSEKGCKSLITDLIERFLV